MKTTTLAVLCFLLIGSNSSAQNRLTLHTGIGVPLGFYGAGTEYFGSVTYESFASLGIFLGGSYQLPLGDKGLFAYGDITITRNAVKPSLRREYLSGLNESTKVNHSEYYNVPIQVGAMYQKNVSENLAVYVRGGVLLNYFKISKSRRENLNGLTYDRKYGVRYGMGYSFETGVVINDKIVIGLGGTRHGRFRIGESYTVTYSDGTLSTEYNEASKNVSMFNLKVGLRL